MRARITRPNGDLWVLYDHVRERGFKPTVTKVKGRAAEQSEMTASERKAKVGRRRLLGAETQQGSRQIAAVAP